LGAHLKAGDYLICFFCLFIFWLALTPKLKTSGSEGIIK